MALSIIKARKVIDLVSVLPAFMPPRRRAAALAAVAALVGARDSPPGLVVVGIFKNEAPHLRPWLDYYLNAQGAVAALLVDNNSTDDWRSAVAPFGDRVRVTTDGAVHRQVALYNQHALPLLKREFQRDWAVVVDLDEYLYARDPGTRWPPTLAQTVRDVLGPGKENHVAVPWKMFGSSGRDAQPGNGTVCGFTRRRNYTGTLRTHTKSLARVAALDRLGVHLHVIAGHQAPHHGVVRQSEELLKAARLHLNHYPIQSKSHFRENKMSRGSATSRTLDTVRTWDFFRKYDWNDVEDADSRRARTRARGAAGLFITLLILL